MFCCSLTNFELFEENELQQVKNCRGEYDIEPGFRLISRDELGNQMFKKTVSLALRAEKYAVHHSSSLEGAVSPPIALNDGTIGTRDGSLLSLPSSSGLKPSRASHVGQHSGKFSDI